MHQLTFYPLGNADTLFIDFEETTSGLDRVFVLDYANVKSSTNKFDLRWDIEADISAKLAAKKRTDVDVFCITHIDNDHIAGAAEFFYLEHAQKYQGEGRTKIKTLWVPSGAITETGVEDNSRIWRAEARHRLKKGKGIRVFGRPARLKQWLESEGLTLESRKHLVTDAGRLIEGFTKEEDKVEFFLHSPHAHRINEREVEDRNQDSIVMQTVFVSGGVETKVIFGGDTTWVSMEDIVSISKKHGNQHRLEFDIFKLPHHCSYKSLSDIKGATKTEPKPLVKEWFEMASERALVISTSERVLNQEQTQPPHFQAKNYHVENINRVNGQFKVTMEHPVPTSPKPMVVNIGSSGFEIESASTPAPALAATQTPARAG